MSRTIDERTVSMRFDHDKFEKGVSSVMSALDKLKSKLNFSSHNFDALTRAANNVSFDGITRGTDRVQASFSALQVVAYTVLSNITTKVQETATSMIRAFTIDPILTGFQEYETQINAVQTILSNTADQGTTLAEVTQALDVLNTYADKTIYNFTEMTRNIGTFTAAGVGLWDSVEAIQGIANLAAVSGSTSQQASTAMYQLSQALSQGYVMLMDWRSVVNAGMGGAYFRNALQETADQMLRFDAAYQQYWNDANLSRQASSVQGLLDSVGGFRNSLETKWINDEVLLTTLRNLTETGANEYLAEHTRLVEQDRQYLGDEIAAMRETAKGSRDLEMAYHDLAEELAATSDLSEEEIFHLLSNSTRAEEAATLVKTVTQLFDTLKEATQSGWTQSWEYIIGDFEEARELLTGVSDAIGGIISAVSNRRNTFLGELLQGNWKKLRTLFSDTGISVNDLQDNLESLSTSAGINLENFESFEDSLSENWVTSSVLNRALADTINGMAEANGATLEFSGNVGDLTKEQLISAGLTSEGAEAFMALADQVYNADSRIGGLLSDLGRVGGRAIIIETLRNTFGSFLKILRAIGDAWNYIFPPENVEDAESFLTVIRDLSRLLVPTDDQLKKIRQTFAGLFAILDIIWTTIKTIVGGIFRVGSRLLTTVLGPIFDSTEDGLLGITARVGEALVAFRDWLKENDRLGRGIRAVWHVIKAIFQGIFYVLKSIWQSEPVQWFVSHLRSAALNFFTSLADKLRILRDQGLRPFLDSIGGIQNLNISNLRDFFAVFGNWARDNIFDGIRRRFQTIIDYLRNFWQNLRSGTSDASNSLEVFKAGFARFIDFIKEHSSQIIAGAFLASLLLFLYGIGKAIKTVTNIFAAVGNVIKNLAVVLDGVFRYLKAAAFEKRATGILKLAIAVGIVVASIVVLSKLDLTGEALKGVIAVGAIFAGLIVVMGLLSKFDSQTQATLGKNGASFSSKNGPAGKILMLSASIVLIAVALSRVSRIRWYKLVKSVLAIGVVLAMMTGLALLIGKFGKGNGSTMLGGAKAIRDLSLSLGVLALSLTLVARLPFPKVIGAAVLLVTIIGVLAAINKNLLVLEEGQTQAKNPLLKMAASMLVIAFALKVMSTIKAPQMVKVIFALAAIVTAMMFLIAVSANAGEHADKAGRSIFLMASAILILSFAIKTLSKIPTDSLATPIAVIGVFFVVFVAITHMVNTLGPGAARTGLMLVGMSAAIAILVGAIYLLSLLNGISLVQPLAVISTLMVAMGLAIGLSHVNGRAGIASLIAFSVCISLLVGMVVALTFLDSDKVLVAATTLGIILLSFVAFADAISKMSTKKADLLNMAVSLGIMLGIVVALGFFVVLISRMTNPEAAMPAALALSALLIAFSIAMQILAKGSTFNPATMGTMAISLAIMLGITVLLSLFIWGLTEINHPDRALNVALALSSVLMAFTGCFAVLSLVGVLAPAALAATLVMLAFVGIFGGLALAIGKNFNPEKEAQVLRGLEVMSAIGHGIGEFIGSTIGGIAEGVSNSLPAIGENVAAFALAIEPFIQTMSQVDDGVVRGVRTISEAVLVLTGSEFINAISGFFFGSDMGDFASQFMLMGAAISGFALQVGTVQDWDSVSNAARNVKTLAEALAAAPTTGGLLDAFTGRFDISNFETGMNSLGIGITKYSKSVSQVSDWNATTVSSRALSVICKALHDCPTEGGLLQGILGQANYASLSAGMVAIATALVNYHLAVSKISDWSSTTASTEALSQVFSALEDAPNSGGLLGGILGDQDYSTLAVNLGEIAKGLVAYSSAIAESPQNWGDVETSSAALSALFNALEDAPNSGGLLERIFGDQDYSNLATNLEEMGNGLVAYANVIDGVDVSTVRSSATAIESLVDSAVTLANFNTAAATLEAFGTRLANFGSSLSDFYNNMGPIDPARLQSLATAITEFIGTIQTVEGADTSGVENISSSLTSGIDQISDAVDEESEETQSAFSRLISGASSWFGSPESSVLSGNVESFASGLGNIVPENIGSALNGGTGGVEGAFDGMLGGSILDPQHQAEARNSGQAIGNETANGIINGIQNALPRVRNGAHTLATTVANAVSDRRGLDIHSPSRVMYRIGNYSILGFINAFKDGLGITERTGRDVANSAIDGFQSSLSRIKMMADIIDSGFDLTPVISPVVDLSNVKRGADAINAMMSTSRAYSVAGGFGSNGIQNGQSNRTTTNVFNITNNVDGSENPEAWALSFAKGLQRKIRMGG